MVESTIYMLAGAGAVTVGAILVFLKRKAPPWTD